MTSPRPLVLFVDDEEHVLAALRRLFRGAPWDQRFVSSASEALALAAEEEGAPDVVVADQRMPGMTGVELLRAIRLRYPRCVRIVLSGYTEVQTILDAVNEGAIFKFLTKPWDDEVLREVVQEAVEVAELRRENERLQTLVATQNEQLEAVNQSLRATLGEGLSAWAMVEALPVGVVAVDEAGRVLATNLESGRLLGSGLWGRRWSDVLRALPGTIVVRASGPVSAPGWQGNLYAVWEA